MSGCSSLEKEAREKLELGDYDAALPLYERLVKKEDANSEYLDGLKRSREGFVGVRLIEIRRSRVSGNLDLALNQLKSVLALQNEWKLSPVGAARFTQDEETQYAWPAFQDRVQGAIRSGHPLLAEYEWRQFQPLFTDPKYLNGLDSLGREVVALGKLECSRLGNKAKMDQPYYAAFVARFCRHYKSSKRIFVNEPLILKDLFSEIKISGNVNLFDENDRGFLASAWQGAFQKSPWYAPKASNAVSTNWSGAIDFLHTTEPVWRVQDYSVEVPYTAVEYVTKTRKNKAGEDESYTEGVEVTRYKSEHREYSYRALFHRQKIQMRLGAEVSIGARKFTLSDQRQYSVEGDEVSESRPDIGLHAHRPLIFEKSEWIRYELASYEEKILNAMKQEWVSAYCSDLGEISRDEGNRVHRCARDSLGLQVAGVQSWYRNVLGVNPSDAESLIAGKL